MRQHIHGRLLAKAGCQRGDPVAQTACKVLYARCLLCLTPLAMSQRLQLTAFSAARQKRRCPTSVSDFGLGNTSQPFAPENRGRTELHQEGHTLLS